MNAVDATVFRSMDNRPLYTTAFRTTPRARRVAPWTRERLRLERRIEGLSFPTHTTFWTLFRKESDTYYMDSTAKGRHRRLAKHRARTTWDRRGNGAPEHYGLVA
jgi:hypothetical protein